MHSAVMAPPLREHILEAKHHSDATTAVRIVRRDLVDSTAGSSGSQRHTMHDVGRPPTHTAKVRMRNACGKRLPPRSGGLYIGLPYVKEG